MLLNVFFLSHFIVSTSINKLFDCSTRFERICTQEALGRTWIEERREERAQHGTWGSSAYGGRKWEEEGRQVVWEEGRVGSEQGEEGGRGKEGSQEASSTLKRTA